MSGMPAGEMHSVTAPGGRRLSSVEPLISVIRDVADLASVRDTWLGLVTDQIAVDPDFFEAGLRADPKIVRPHVVVLERDGERSAMLIARLERLELRVRAGYRTLYAPRVRSITVVYGGILGEVDEGAFELLLGSVRDSLAKGEADVAIFRHLPLESALHRIAAGTPPFLARQHVMESEIHWELSLPESLDDVLRSLSTSSRKNTKWYTRRLERDYKDSLAVRIFTEPAELDDFFRDVEAVSAKTYQRALGVSFGDTPAHRERTRVSMEQGWFRGYVLYLDGRPCAFQHGELYGGRFRLGTPGYDPELARLSVGTYLLLRLIDDLCADDNARVFDYGLGDADYKRRFGTRSWTEGSVLIYAPTLRAATINVVRTTLLKSVGLAKSVIGSGELFHRIKRGWRRRLTGAGSPAS
jgi:hypothetical protein